MDVTIMLKLLEKAGIKEEDLDPDADLHWNFSNQYRFNKKLVDEVQALPKEEIWALAAVLAKL